MVLSVPINILIQTQACPRLGHRAAAGRGELPPSCSTFDWARVAGERLGTRTQAPSSRWRVLCLPPGTFLSDRRRR